MADSVSLVITEEQRLKASNEMEDAKSKFPNIDINITYTEITFTGNVYQELIECKHYFAVKLGIYKLRKKRERTEEGDDTVPNTSTQSYANTKYVTYEKIDVIVIKANLIDFDGEIDCFVNTTNHNLEAFSMVSKAIKDAGGQAYEHACRDVKQEALRLKTTECIETIAGDMEAQNIIHAICPVHTDYMFQFSSKGMANDVFLTVFNCLKMAERLGVHSIALPFLSTGHGQLDIKICTEQYAFAILEFSRLRVNQFVVETIYFIDINENKVDIANEVFKQIIPTSGLELLEIPREALEIATYAPEYSDEDLEENNDAVDGKRLDYDECTHVDEGMVINEDYETIPFHTIRPQVTESKDYENLATFHKNIGKYTVKIEKGDIRNTKMVAIVCPEIEGMKRGGLLAASIKCTFRQSFDEKKLSKLHKNAIATTECTTENGSNQYVLHVKIPIWRDNINEKQLEKTLKGATMMIFDKIRRHKNRHISSLAIPLLGIGKVENNEVVSKCCKWQVEQIVTILQRNLEIPNLEEVTLVNRCEKITNTLITHLEVFLAK